MDLETAIEVFSGFLALKQDELGKVLASASMRPERLSRGWAFYCQSRAYVETGDFGSMLIGHGPAVILDDGRIIEGGSLDIEPNTLLTG